MQSNVIPMLPTPNGHILYLDVGNHFKPNLIENPLVNLMCKVKHTHFEVLKPCEPEALSEDSIDLKI